METKIKTLIRKKDYKAISDALANDRNLANQGIPYDDLNPVQAHPLHRICDDVFTNKYTDDEAVEIAKIFLSHGANVNGNQLMEKHDTPLIAAASLHADQVAMFYIENGAYINHAGTHGGTALHWAAWCGRSKVVKKLIEEGAEINKLCIDFQATPLFWAVLGLKRGDKKDFHNHLECVKLLVQSGAERNIPNVEGKTVFDLLDDQDLALKEVLSRA